jgi:hypothetical protein
LLRFDLDVHDQNRVREKTQIYVNVSSFNFSVSAHSLRVASFDITSRISRISIKQRFRILIVSKIDEFSNDRQAVINDDDDEEFDVNDDNRSNCIRCCCISIDCRRIANIACSRCFKQKTACISIRFEFVSDVSLFNSHRSRFVFVSSSINCLTLVSFYASTRYHWKHSWESERFYNFIWLYKIVSKMTEKMLTRLTKRRYELMRKNCFLWKISRTRFALLSSERSWK